MNYPIKKLTKTFCVPFLSIPLLIAANSSFAAESLDERIQKLESLVNELKQQVKQQARQEKREQQEKKEQQNKQEELARSNSKHTYSFGGFIKATASFSDYDSGDLASGSAGRDFFIPGAIPVGGQDESQDFDFSAKETRLNFKSKHELDNGETLTTYLEMDFLLAPGGNERVSNSYNPRLRHAFFTYNKWLFGQTWSTFQDVGALPESVDFLAASDGIVFERQPMVRYTNGAWQFSLENPETTITPFGGGARIVADDNSLPDFVARYNHKADWGHFTASTLFRQLEFSDGANDESTSALGISLTGKIKLAEKDDIRFNLATGSGMGRYVGLNTSNGAVIDANGDLEAIDSTLVAIAYRHFWNNQWRSNFIISGIDVDNDIALTGTSVTKSVDSFQLNLLYSPVSKLTLGLGLLSANRELEDGLEGDMQRLIFSAKYGF